MENVIERMNRIDAKTKIGHFIAKERLPYDFKVKYAKIRAEEFVSECLKRNLGVHVSLVGWIVLLCFYFCGAYV